MTVKQMSDLFNVSTETIKRAIRELYPTLMQKGKTTRLTKDQSIKLGEVIRKTGYIEPAQNVQVPAQNVQVDLIKTLVIEIVKPILEQQNNFNKALVQEIKQIRNQSITENEHLQKMLPLEEYYTVKEYVLLNMI